eukprot:174151_1
MQSSFYFMPHKLLSFIPLLLVNLIDGSILNSFYTGNFTLTQLDSPYYVNNDVVFYETVRVEKGAEIVFNSNNKIEIRGRLDACIDKTVMDDSIRGLTNVTTAIYIHGNQQRIGTMFIDTEKDATASFCNTKFELMSSAITVTCCG